MLKPLSLLAAALIAAGPVFGGEIATSVDAGALPAGKQTPLGLYLTPADAHAALEGDPGILFIDVRDPIEVAFTGHPDPVDAIVPLMLSTHEFSPERGSYAMVPNTGFLAQVEAVRAREGLDKEAPVFVMCRSGGRSAAAAAMLAEAGYTNVWSLIEGFEGDSGPDGQRNVNGWRNAGLPWGYKIDPAAAWQPAAAQ